MKTITPLPHSGFLFESDVPHFELHLYAEGFGKCVPVTIPEDSEMTEVLFDQAVHVLKAAYFGKTK